MQTWAHIRVSERLRNLVVNILGFQIPQGKSSKFSSSFFFNFILKFSFHWGTNNEVLGILFMFLKNSSISRIEEIMTKYVRAARPLEIDFRSHNGGKVTSLIHFSIN